MAAGNQVWRQVKQGPHREHFPALWRALRFVLPPIPPQRSGSFPGLTMRLQVLQSAIFSCIMQTAYRFVGVELRFRHPLSRDIGGRDVHREFGITGAEPGGICPRALRVNAVLSIFRSPDARPSPQDRRFRQSPDLRFYRCVWLRPGVPEPPERCCGAGYASAPDGPCLF